MTPDEWDHCDNWTRAIRAANRSTITTSARVRRKFRLFAVYALRHVASHAEDNRFSLALDVAERHFDERSTLDELKAAIATAQHGYEVHRSDLEEVPELLAQSLNHLLAGFPIEAATGAGGTAAAILYRLARPHDRAVRQPVFESVASDFPHLIREMFGNPFRPVAFDPSWRTSAAVGVARQMYDTRDFSGIPILADALQDAGCDSDDVLNHCRNAGIHVRGCWVVDLVLGKT